MLERLPDHSARHNPLASAVKQHCIQPFSAQRRPAQAETVLRGGDSLLRGEGLLPDIHRQLGVNFPLGDSGRPSRR